MDNRVDNKDMISDILVFSSPDVGVRHTAVYYFIFILIYHGHQNGSKVTN